MSYLYTVSEENITANFVYNISQFVGKKKQTVAEDM